MIQPWLIISRITRITKHMYNMFYSYLAMYTKQEKHASSRSLCWCWVHVSLRWVLGWSASQSVRPHVSCAKRPSTCAERSFGCQLSLTYKTLLSFGASSSSSSCILLIIPLVRGSWAGPIPSSPPTWEGFVLKSGGSSSTSSPTKGVRYVILKVVCTPYSSRRSNW